MKLEYAEVIRDFKNKIVERRKENIVIPIVVDEIVAEIEKEYENVQ